MDPEAFGLISVRFRYTRTKVYLIRKVSSLRLCPSPLNVGGLCRMAASLV